MVYIPNIEELSYLECTICKNYFFIHEITTGNLSGMNDPNYCPYCGCEFEETLEINNENKGEIDENNDDDINEY